MANDDRPVPNCMRYGFGEGVGYVELHADWTVEFWLGDSDPMDHGVKMTEDQLPVLREIVKHLERGNFAEDAQ